MFRLIYGGSAWSYAHDPDFTHVSTREKFWQDIIDKTYAKYKGLGSWHTELVRTVYKDGKLVMPTGRQYTFERIKGEFPRTQILNYPVQGLGADLLSLIRVSLMKRMKKDYRLSQSNMVCTVHDSILIDTSENKVDILKELIDNVFKDMNRNFEKVFGVPFTLPLRCETSVGSNWGEMEVV
jgi:DNA polymerase I-like protein with 3'-5' exonuclease and polymerase domains